jgi:hypothetical protein
VGRKELILSENRKRMRMEKIKRRRGWVEKNTSRLIDIVVFIVEQPLKLIFSRFMELH